MWHKRLYWLLTCIFQLPVTTHIPMIQEPRANWKLKLCTLPGELEIGIPCQAGLIGGCLGSSQSWVLVVDFQNPIALARTGHGSCVPAVSDSGSHPINLVHECLGSIPNGNWSKCHQQSYTSCFWFRQIWDGNRRRNSKMPHLLFRAFCNAWQVKKHVHWQREGTWCKPRQLKETQIQRRERRN